MQNMPTSGQVRPQQNIHKYKYEAEAEAVAPQKMVEKYAKIYTNIAIK